MNTNTKKHVEEFTTEAKKTMEQGVEKMTRGIEDATQFSQENIEAMVESTRIAAKAGEAMNAEIMAFSKKSYEDSMAAAKEMTNCKSVTEFVEKQTKFARSSFEGFVSQANKINEIYISAAKDVFAPINKRMTAAADMVKSHGA